MGASGPTHSPNMAFDPSQLENLLMLNVDDPKNEGYMATKYTTYRITCGFRGGGGATSGCRHRYSDFLTLRNELMNGNPGVVVPPLPQK